MLKSLKFQNFRILRNAELPFTSCTLLLGANGSGKSTVLRGLNTLRMSAAGSFPSPNENVSVGATSTVPLEIEAKFQFPEGKISVEWKNSNSGNEIGVRTDPLGHPSTTQRLTQKVLTWVSGIRVFSLDANAIARPVTLLPSGEIAADGENLPIVLTQLQDQFPERFESLNRELPSWFPEFDRILFDTPGPGQRGFSLRTTQQKKSIKAADLSQGTLLAMCILTLAHLPEPPSLVCLEEPDRGIHPRLLRQVHDSMIRLSRPETCGDSRKPVQVIATTHSPYFLDHFRDHPQDVVLAEKIPDGATFHRLTDMSHYKEIMDGASLGDAWYTGILGGVPARP